MKKAVFIVSVIFNVLFLLVVIFIFALTSQVASFSFLKHDSGTHCAFIVSVPSAGADLSFGPAEFALGVGSQASLQFAVIRDSKQSNLAMEPLYDHAIVSVEQTGFGLLITGLSPGEAVLQLFSPNGFRTIARVFVY